MASVFSRIVKGEIPSYKISENEKFYSFLDINPMAEGHVLVIPKQEVDYIFDLDDATLSEMIIFSKQVAQAIKLAVPCQRVGMMVIGMEVPHAHIHLIPINKESDMNLSNPKLKPSKEDFEMIAEKILDLIEENDIISSRLDTATYDQTKTKSSNTSSDFLNETSTQQ